MKHVLLFSLLSFFFFTATSQNLVPNPSFEERSGCPEGYPDLDDKLDDWMSFRGTPDYFHSCSSLNGFHNNWGYQEPHSGEAYTSIISYSATGNPSSLMREHLGVELLSPLQIGVKYYVTFYVSAAWEPVGMTIGSSKTGALFTTYEYQDELSQHPLNNNSQVWLDDVVSDTVNWIKVSGTIIADSAYSYLVVGNFFEDAFTDTVNFPNQIGFNQRAMQYIDDVCVSTDSLYAHNWTAVSIDEIQEEYVSVYPNPASNWLNINLSTGQKPTVITLVDMLGRVLLHQPFATQLDVSHLPAGSYVLVAETEKGMFRKRVVIE